MAYAAGTLPEAFSLMVATHVSLCDTCRGALDSYDAMGGIVLDEGAKADMAVDSLDQTLAKLDDAMDSPVHRHVSKGGPLPLPLQEYIGGDLSAVRWTPIGMGVKQAILPTSKDATARLLYIPAGTAVPDHGHHGREMTMVLQGAFMDGDERYARGDVEIADEDLHHQPIADIAEDCICLAVTDAPLRFNGILPRIVQKFVRI